MAEWTKEIEIIKATLVSAMKTGEDTLKRVKEALAAKDLTKYNLEVAVLQKNCNDINKIVRKVEYCKFLATASPMVEAVKQFYVETYRVKEERDKDNDTITDVGFQKKKTRIDLEEFCDFGGLSKKWVSDSQKLLSLLALRETNVFKMSAADLNSKSFYFIQQAKAKKEGATPDSNTQIVRMLQTIIDEMIFVDNGEGKNAYKCTSHDLVFIHDAVTKMDAKEKCTIATMNERQFKTVLASVLAHCLGETYTVKAAKVKENT